MGNTGYAFQDMQKQKIGLEDEYDYPYTSVETHQRGQCHINKTREQVFVADSKSIDPDEDQIAAALVRYGPLAISINATESLFHFYRSGILTPTEENCSPVPNHGVNIVGYGTDPSGVQYWIVRNSWNKYWGED